MDVKNLKRILKFNRILCLVPWNFDSGTKSALDIFTYVTGVTKIITAILVLMVPILFLDQQRNFSFVEQTLSWIDGVCWVCSTMACVASAFRHQLPWNNFFGNLVEIDSILDKNDALIIKKSSFVTRLIIYHSYLVLSLAGLIFSNKAFTPLDVITLVQVKFLIYQKQIFLITFIYLTDVISNRYRCIDQLLRRTFEKKEEHQVFSRIEDVKKMLRLLDHTIFAINVIAGYQFLMLVINSFFSTLNIFNFGLYVQAMGNKVPYGGEVIGAYIWERVIFFIMSMIVIRKCENVRSSYSEILISCNEFHAYAYNTMVRQQLILLFDYARNMPPKFMAAGFFELNLDFISSFVSALIAHLIIVMQFKTAQLKEIEKANAELGT